MKKDDDIGFRSDIVIEGNLAKYQIAALGSIAGTYAGEFVFRCFLSPSQQIAANREYRELLGANPVLAPEHESFLAYALTQLKYRIVSSPPFWTATQQINGISGDLADEEIISNVLDAAIHAQLKYKDGLYKRKIELLEKAKAAAQRILDGKEAKEDEEEFNKEVDEDEDEE